MLLFFLNSLRMKNNVIQLLKQHTHSRRINFMSELKFILITETYQHLTYLYIVSFIKGFIYFKVISRFIYIRHQVNNTYTLVRKICSSCSGYYGKDFLKFKVIFCPMNISLSNEYFPFELVLRIVVNICQTLFIIFIILKLLYE